MRSTETKMEAALAARRHRAFTLTEMLVSIAVLTMLILLVTQLVNSATAVMTRGRKSFDADGDARMVFDRMAIDFSRMLRRGDADFFGKDSSGGQPMTGNDQIAFYSAVPGYYSPTATATATPSRNQRSPISVAGYCMSADPAGRPQLVRLAKGLVWEPDGGWQDVAYLPIRLVAPSTVARWPGIFTPASGSPRPFHGMGDADFETISESVVRFEYTYLLRPTATAPAAPSNVPFNSVITGHTTANFHQDVAAIVVAIAILDPASRVIVTDYSQLTSNSLFADATETEIAVPWTAAVTNPAFAATARIPKTAASAVRVYQRRFSLGGAAD